MFHRAAWLPLSREGSRVPADDQVMVADGGCHQNSPPPILDVILGHPPPRVFDRLHPPSQEHELSNFFFPPFCAYCLELVECLYAGNDSQTPNVPIFHN